MLPRRKPGPTLPALGSPMNGSRPSAGKALWWRFHRGRVGGLARGQPAMTAPIRSKTGLAVRLGERLDVVQFGANRVLAIVNHHVLRHAIVEEAHAELVIRFLGAGVDREKGEPHAPAGPLKQGAARRSCRIGGELAPDHRGDLNRILVGRPIEDQARDKILAAARGIYQQDCVSARKHDARLEPQGLRLRLREFRDTAFPGTVEPRLTPNLLIEFAIAHLLLIEAV